MHLKKVLIIAGGTGGHIFPALAIARALRNNQVEVDWLGAKVGMESKIIGNEFPLYLLPIQAMRGKSVSRKLLAPVRLLRSIRQSLRLIKKLKPQLVIGMGGYASAPGCIAAWLARKPLVIHEQNAIAGLTNRWLSKVATRVYEAFPNAFRADAHAMTIGNPLRDSLINLQRSPEHTQGKLNVLIMGGSQGSQLINQAIVSLLPLLTHLPLHFWHQTGEKEWLEIKKQYENFSSFCYRVDAFIQTMEEAYAWADVMICRAGALTVSEAAAVGLPCIFIPLSIAVDDHQTQNAKYLSDKNAAFLLGEHELSAEKLLSILNELLSDPMKLYQMSIQAKQLAETSAVARIITDCQRLVS